MISAFIIVGGFIGLPTCLIFALVSLSHNQDEPHLKRALEVRQLTYEIEEDA